jgi:hypothetical protein
VEYTVAARLRRGRAGAPRRSLIASVDPALVRGEWTWTWKAGGLELSTTGRKRRA